MPSADEWHPDGVYVNSSADPDPGTHRGLDAIANQIQTWIEAYPDLRVDPIEILVNGDRALVWARWCSTVAQPRGDAIATRETSFTPLPITRRCETSSPRTQTGPQPSVIMAT
jgi:hypothetical protein